MSIKYKIMRISLTNPKIVTIGIVLAITFAISALIGMVDNGQALSDNYHDILSVQNQENSGNNAFNLNDGNNALGQQ